MYKEQKRMLPPIEAELNPINYLMVSAWKRARAKRIAASKVLCFCCGTRTWNVKRSPWNLLAKPGSLCNLAAAYPRKGGKRRYLLLSEAPDSGQKMPFTAFRRRVKRFLPKLDSGRPRTTPIEDVAAADTILGFWTPGGRLARR
jgi:hypothetical protein